MATDFTAQIASALAPLAGLSEEEIMELIETPPNPELGDFAFPCFRLAKTLKKAPPAIAAELAQNVTAPPFVDKVVLAGAYVNFYLNPAALAREVLGEVLSRGARYGSSDMGEKRKVCIDYSSINIAKPFHIGHLSTTVIGHALYNIYEFLGYECVGINHLGDWGTQFGKLITAYKLWGDKQEIERGGTAALTQLYVRFHEEAERDSALDDHARAWFRKIETGDTEALELFNWFKQLTLKDVERVYGLLGIRFDSYAGESFYNDKMDVVVDELKAKNLLVCSDGAYIVDLSAYEMPPCIILRSDGATLYATRDIAAALYRKSTYDFHKALYVVAYQQSLHFSQLFKVIELMGYDWAADMEHVAFGMVSMEDGTLSTRKGRVVLLEDVLGRAVDKTLEIIKQKSPDLEDKETVAKQVGVGAVVFSALYNSRIKDVVFSWDKALNFDGETGPYVQYTHARCASVLRKAGQYGAIDYAALGESEAMNVLRALATFPEAVRGAMRKNEPSAVARKIMELCQTFNKFYYEHRIMADEEGVKNARLALTDAVKTVICAGLGLLGINAPERM